MNFLSGRLPMTANGWIDSFGQTNPVISPLAFGSM